MQNKSNESGRTMLEMLGVLAIMGVIMYGAIAGIGFGVNMYKINASFNDLEELSQGIIDLYSWTSQYPSNPTDIEDAVEDNGVLSGATFLETGIQGQFGGSTMYVRTTGDRSRFAIEYRGLPEMACSRLVHMSYANMMPVPDGQDGSSFPDVDPAWSACASSCNADEPYFCLLSR